MIIFISIPWFAPAYKAGGPIQSISNLIENYNENISYKIYCGNKDLDGQSLVNIKTNEWVTFSKNTDVYYSSLSSYSILKNEIKFIKPDVLFIIGLFSWHYNILPVLLKFANKKILSVRGMLHPGALSQKSFRKKIFLSALKILAVNKKLSFHATDATEEVYIKNIFGSDAKVYISSNFSKVFNNKISTSKNIGQLKLITIALISPMKNHLLVLQALKNCKENIEYTICGPIKDEAYWQQCVEEIKTMPSNIIVNYVGEINPVLVENELSKNHIFIMPSKSENFGHAISEALSCGMPVITSKFTPWNNLENAGAGINVENNINSIQNAISYFASIDQNMFDSFKKSTLHYFQIKNEVDKKKESYKVMFAK